MTASGTNALASAIVLSLRPRPDDAPISDRRGYLDLLRDELPGRLRELQQGAIAPVDLAQAAIGPGMAIFTRFSRVVDPDGSDVTVRDALRLIDAVLAEVLSDQEGDFDSDTRWCVKWFETHGWGTEQPAGEAEVQASAYNTSVKGLDRSGAVYAKGGEVRLLDDGRAAKGLPPRTRRTHHPLGGRDALRVKALDEDGVADAGRILHGATGSRRSGSSQGARLPCFCPRRETVDRSGFTQIFNALVTSWPEVTSAAKAWASGVTRVSDQTMLDLDDELGG